MCIHSKSKKIIENYMKQLLINEQNFQIKTQNYKRFGPALRDYTYECICVCFDIEEISPNLEKANKFPVTDNKHY